MITSVSVSELERMTRTRINLTLLESLNDLIQPGFPYPVFLNSSVVCGNYILLVEVYFYLQSYTLLGPNTHLTKYRQEYKEETP